MSRKRAAVGKRIARALIAFLVVSIALGRPLDSAAHAASEEIKAGNPSLFLKFIAAFDVIDDDFDYPVGEAAPDKVQLVIQLALPASEPENTVIVHVTETEHVQRLNDAVTSHLPPPLERPPRA